MSAVEVRIERGMFGTLPAPNEQLLAVWMATLRKAVMLHLQQIENEKIKLNGPVVITLNEFNSTAKGKTLDLGVRLSIKASVPGERRNELLHVTRHIDPRNHWSQSLHHVTESMLTIRDSLLGIRSISAITEELVAGDPFFSDVNVRALERLDDALGRSEAVEIRFWRHAQFATRTFTALAMLPPVMAIDEPLLLRLMVSGMLGFVVYFVLYALAVCCMPVRFFDEYGAGKRVKRFARTTTGQETQTAVRLATALLICGLAAAIVATMNLFRSE